MVGLTWDRWAVRVDRVLTMSAGAATRKGIYAGDGDSGGGYKVCEADGG